MTSPKTSVVIPTFNAGPGFENLLGKLFTQETDFDYEVVVYEVVVVDSGSMDSTLRLA